MSIFDEYLILRLGFCDGINLQVVKTDHFWNFKDVCDIRGRIPVPVLSDTMGDSCGIYDDIWSAIP